MYTPFACKSNFYDSNSATVNSLKDVLNVVFSEELDCNSSERHLIDGRVHQRNLVILEGNVLFNIARKQWKQAEEAALTETIARNVNVAEVRQQITTILSSCCFPLRECKNGPQRVSLQSKLLQYLKQLKACVTSWRDFAERLLVKLTSPSVRDDQLPVYHYFHMYLDLQWLVLTLTYMCDAPLEVLEEIVKDLVALSQAWYQKHRHKDITQTGAFVCPCVKQLWIQLQFFSEKLFKGGLLNSSFWEIFNNAVGNSDEEFALWLLHHIAMLQGYNEDGEFIGPTNLRVCENHTLVERKLKSLNVKCAGTTSDNNQVLLNCCKLIDPLLNQWWVQNAKSEPYQALWEIFNKHINVTSSTDRTKKSAIELVEAVDHIMSHLNTSSSYEYFLHMLNKHLTKHPTHWPRMRGRIYCKLPTHKINEFSNTGLCNITLLFLTLANSISMAEMTEKLSALLSNLTRERQSSPLVLNIHFSLVILHVRQRLGVKHVCRPLLQGVQEATSNRETFHLVRLYVDGVDAVLNASPNFDLQQYVLVGGWVSKYLVCCQYSDLCYCLNVLLCNMKRIRGATTWPEWEQVLKEHLLPTLKAVATSANAPAQVGELAAQIDTNPLSDYVLIFTSDIIAPKVTCQFISTLLEDIEENYVLPKNHETAILHAWVRCCLLNCENNDKLSRNVSKISALASLPNAKLVFANNPLCDFIKCINKYDAKLLTLRELCEQCFGRLDSWVVSYLAVPPSEPLTLHMYTCMALLFFHCAPLLYHKNRSSCLLNRLVSAFLLPTDVLMGKPPHSHVLSAILRTWHLFMQGIYALDYCSDAYLERTLRDMVVRYLPLFPVADSPILKCLGKESLAALVFEKIAGAFMSHSSRYSGVNTTKALKILLAALESASCVDAMTVILRSTLVPVLEVVMFHADKNAALDIIKYVSSCDKYGQLKEHVKKSFVQVTERHLAFNVNSYFQFAATLVKIIPEEMHALLPDIKKQVSGVERMRGVGYDNTLRQGLDRLEKLLL